MGKLTDLIRSSKSIVAFTGAGVSTLAGIRDFRGKNGVYRQLWHGYQVEEILSLDCFERQPELFYEWAREFVYCLDDFNPGAMHTALAHLEQIGKLPLGIYTQNIDLLHQKAGSSQVYEIHGSPARHHCLSCRCEQSYAEVAPTVMKGHVPHCPKCGGVMKPDIVFYGENLDEALLQKGLDIFGRADLALVMGSSLTVYPAAALPEAAARNGVKTVIINEQPTHLDDLAALHLESLEAAAAELSEC